MASGAGHPRWVAGFVSVLLLVLAGCGGTEINPPKPPGNSIDQRAAAAAGLLQQLGHGLLDGNRAGVLALAAPDKESRAAVAAIYTNARSLRLSHIDFRYVDENQGSLQQRVTKAYGDRAWAADVVASWRIPTYDPGDTHLATRLTFVATDKGVRLVSAGGGGQRGALWLDGPLEVARGVDTLVLVAAGSPTGYERMARQAVVDVRKELHLWRGRLVIEVPGTERELESVLGARSGEYSAIAAVTTTVDGTLVPGAPVHVFVNPGVFDGLGPRGSQVVLSHEATHVATNATFTSMPVWLLEGFADFVALAHSHVPFATAASQILKHVRDKGAPNHLPTAGELDPSATALGATYEEAWTVCRYLAKTYGDPKMVAFYWAVDKGSSTQQAFRDVLGTTQPTFVRGWRKNLIALAGGQGGV
ncbi:MAG: hypothetical protein M3Y66_08995 [Actinomycetota bacterium]|nr:hypothetical protein [Actinomycetota bacterium]